MKAMYIILDCILAVSALAAIWLFVVLLFSLN
jgi:hypothetical protein